MFMKKLTAEQNFKKDRLSSFFLAALIFAVIGLSVGRVVIANRLVEAGEKLRSLDQSTETAKKANQRLAEAVRLPQSLFQIEEKAKALGFVKTSHLVFLDSTERVALLR